MFLVFYLILTKFLALMPQFLKTFFFVFILLNETKNGFTKIKS